MFKSAEQVTTFIDLLEKFTKAVIHHQRTGMAGDATVLNKARGALEEFTMVACGITTASDNTTDTWQCPDCGGEMALRTNRTNGDKFYGCRKYPQCRGTRDSSGLSKAEREEQKYKTHQSNYSQESGFSFNKGLRNAATEASPPQVDFNPFHK